MILIAQSIIYSLNMPQRNKYKSNLQYADGRYCYRFIKPPRLGKNFSNGVFISRIKYYFCSRFTRA
ncbi:hypothetical protein D0T87_08640 [Bacteroides sp. 51]|nr:hypothetical protein [Bacteroides sp. 51]